MSWPVHSAITKYLRQQKFISHRSGGWNIQVKLLILSVSGEGS